MTPQPLDQHGHLGGLAYRLGHAAIALHLDARRRWELAEPGNPADEFFGPEEPSSPFPRELSRHSEVINDASRGLVAALPELDPGPAPRVPAAGLASRSRRPGWARHTGG